MLQNALSFIVLLGVLVTVHELGHFLVAKACGVKVLKFSIGFGPKLIGFTKGETEYQIALLPLGGFVKMAGDMPHEELSPEEASRGFLAQPPWKRGLIVLAGPAFNLIFPVLIYFFVFLGPHQAISTLVGSVSPGMPAAAAGIRPGDRVLSVEGEPVRTFDDMTEAFVGRFDRPIPVVVERDGQQLTFQVTPVKTVDTSPIETVERGKIGVEALSRPSLVGVPPGSLAEQSGLRTFDRVLAVNDVAVQDEARLYQALAKHPEGTPLKLTVRRLEPVQAGAVTGRAAKVLDVTVPKQAGEGLAAIGAEPADLYVALVASGSAAEKAGLKAGDRIVSLDGKTMESFYQFTTRLSAMKEQPFTLTWRGAGGERTEKLAQAPLEMVDGMGNPSKPVVLGVRNWDPRYADRTAEDQVTVHFGPGEAFKEAALIVPKIVGQMVKVIGGLITRDVPLSTVGGPIMMYQMAAKSAERGLDTFLELMAIISINLGVMNLLPIPVLDGFHLLSAAWEGIRRRPIPVRVREVANMVGLALLIMLMLLAVSNDVMR
ncbi:RIP metalloprotease RseP [Pyxidicoccus fallax]|uniref:RIP metalloprotease RseP n=1 Tax=Pyxidicoccus fallax TaxID=394095 RepID=A0A848LTF6_9BACT|nr:RIP metalloprotease RseP [Pyxidicoccus fallax]NMO20959.1 RIP metalloprotease RseP [Pyxidicoccus fallax]NPC82075.1 RIP metalloprotease RseP [Pyxidicoccus fallax]